MVGYSTEERRFREEASTAMKILEEKTLADAYKFLLELKESNENSQKGIPVDHYCNDTSSKRLHSYRPELALLVNMRFVEIKDMRYLADAISNVDRAFLTDEGKKIFQEE